MSRLKLQRETRVVLEESGFHVMSAYQMPQDDGRKLKRVAEPGDPWIASLFLPDGLVDGKAVCFHARELAYGRGSSADEAVLDALANKAKGLLPSYRRLEGAIDALILSIRGRTA